ncbi:tetratricopeptide repeat protein [Mucisphaera calidilacus]|uniref:Uncharacterized protein n=1 Tax=Mucisphaera calidilacus TaxID=2527982 RepID=A0A518BZU5_9BACT|nr:hypothetical protein [Mucisphaera calidilacus]QDU72496.1 hypothetical protein Pan265_23620 [Mucisphaera calidilacus]
MGRIVEQAMQGDRVGAMLGLSDWLMRGGAPADAAVLRRALGGVMPVSLDDAEGAVDEQTLDELTRTLAGRLTMLPTVVRGLEIRGDDRWIEAVHDASVRCWPHAEGREDRLAICRALVRLNILQDDPEGVIRWAHKGLRIEPSDADLALALSRYQDDPEAGPPVRVVLTRVARRWPGYRDVRAALIRRRADDGHQASARRMLERWLRREPDAPLARRLREELTA